MSNSAHDQATFLQGVGAGMRAVEAVIRELAQSNVTVLLLAEAGAGKRTVARYIHESSVRSAEPFCFAACAGVTPDRKSTRLNSSHQIISYAVFCLKKKKYIILVCLY